jgi:hypothetical protein
MTLMKSPTKVIRFGATLCRTVVKSAKAYQGDELDKEFPPVVEDLVHERVAT